jgi:hypothetical protein
MRKTTEIKELYTINVPRRMEYVKYRICLPPLDYTDAAAVDERIPEAIEKIVTLEGLEIEICGLWVWVGGTTRPHKQELKAAGYSWAPQKEKWYFAGVRRRIPSIRDGRDPPAIRQPARIRQIKNSRGGSR